MKFTEKLKKILFFGKFKGKIKAKTEDRLFLFRLFATIFVLDFIAFLSLASISPLQFINPLRFLYYEAKDLRSEITLYFPRAFGNETSGTAELMATRQRVYQIPISDGANRTATVLENARHILTQLELGSDDMKTRRVIKERNSFADVWLYQNTLVVKVNPIAWQAIPPAEQELARQSVEKSLAANLPVDKVVLDLSAVR